MTDLLIETDTKIIPERGKKIALARVDSIRKWQEFRHNKIDKLKADYEFVQLNNTSQNSPLYQILVKVWRGSFQLWKTKLDGTEESVSFNILLYLLTTYFGICTYFNVLERISFRSFWSSLLAYIRIKSYQKSL